VKKILQESDVVLTTCAGAGDPDLADLTYQFVLVDEATQTKEHTLLCALSHGARQLVLIGDPRQLGPLVSIETNWSWLDREDCEQVASGLGCTLFHKLFDGGMRHYMLDVQYRRVFWLLEEVSLLELDILTHSKHDDIL
jgi:regulator of nonsense transcripts 1